MFGATNPFGQSSTSPFGSQSVFGQSNNQSSNLFAPKPFGSTTPFGSQTGSSIFGGTSTGVFGAAQSSSPFSSTTTFGASSSPAFGISVPAFGSSSNSAFGSSSSSSFSGSSVFGQKPVFGGFGSTTQTSPFGNAGQPSQPAFGSSIFGSSTPFGAPTQSPFGSTSTPAFGSTSTPAFGSTSTPAFGAPSTPAFGSTSNPTFGSPGTAFGVSSSPVFGAGGAFGASSTSIFGSSSTSTFGISSTPTFGASSAPAFGASSTPSFSFGSTQTFGQSTSAFSSSPFGSSASPFGGQSSPFGPQTTASTLGSTGIGQSGLGGQRGGSRFASYTPTTETDGGTSGQTAKLESISAMSIYKDKSHEELRWEDYQIGDKGGPLPSAQSTGVVGFSSSTTKTNTFTPSPAFGQSSANPFSASTPSNPFVPKSLAFTTGFGTSTAPAFSSSAFGSSTSATAPSIFGSSTSTFGVNNPSPLFNSSPAPGTSSPFSSSINFGNTQSSHLFSSAAPTIAQPGSAFGQATSPFGQNTSAFNQPSLFSSPSSGLGGSLFSNSASFTSSNLAGFGQTAPSLSTPFQTGQAAQPSGTFAFSNFGQTQPVGASSYGGTPGIFGQSNFGLSSSAQSPAVVQAAPITNPFGTLPALPQMSISRAGSAPSIQYGISSMPVN